MVQSHKKGYGARRVHSHTWPGLCESYLMKTLQREELLPRMIYIEIDHFF